jgi:hypothetical protein
MTISASHVFSFLEQHRICSIEKHELHSAIFTTLRRSMRQIVTRLSGDGDADSHDTADRLRILLSEWLTVPVLFDSTLLESVSSLGDASVVERRWGHEVRKAYDHACAAARAIQHVENPARGEVGDTVRQLRSSHSAWRIYCHRRARVHFESIFQDEPLTSNEFLHSVKEYRDVEPFEVLIKVGPLRSKGWGSAPDAIISAPRFARLVHIVWSGCGDDDDFGFDPAVPSSAAPSASRDVDRGMTPRPAAWTREVIHVGDSVSDPALADSDELEYFYELARAADVRRATLVQIDDEDGILYPPHSQVATFDPTPNSDEPIGYRQPGDTLTDGMFLILPLLGAADLGGVRAGEGHYSRIWKDRLRAEVLRAPDDLLQRLRATGIELRNLRSCVRQWCRPPSTVIHAPQQRRHFEMLIRVLRIDYDAPPAARTLRRPWWEYAWAEIGHARGEAIQTGMQEHEIIDEQLFAILNELLPVIRRRAETEDIFEIEIPANRPLTGAARFYRVRSIEEGFLVPDTILKVISDLDTIEQWRV